MRVNAYPHITTIATIMHLLPINKTINAIYECMRVKTIKKYLIKKPQMISPT